MTGPKLNDGELLVADDQPITKATAKYLRGSASKAREVLDLIRGLDVRRADEVLQFTTRDVAKDVRKVLASAVANAVHNDEQDAEELFVLACYADEGPTLRRFRPRARGRATRIRKRTCHITVVVARLSDDRLEVLKPAPPPSRPPAGAGPARRPRAAATASSAAAPAPRACATAPPRPRRSRRPPERRCRRRRPHRTSTPSTRPRSSPTMSPRCSRSRPRRRRPPTSPRASSPTSPTRPGDAGDRADLPEGAVEAPADGSVPDGYEIKGNANSMKYHVPGGRYYDITIAEVFFDTAEHAEAAGYEAPIPRTTRDRRPPSAAPMTPGEQRAAEEEATEWSEDQPVRVPSRRHHRLEEPLVQRAPVQGLPHRGLEDP